MSKLEIQYEEFPLRNLFYLLKQHGFEVSVRDIIQIEYILTAKHTSFTTISAIELSAIITPFIAKGEQDQQQLKYIIDTVLDQRIHTQEKKKPIVTVEQPKPSNDISPRFFLVLGLYVLALIMLYTSSPKLKPIVKSNVVVDTTIFHADSLMSEKEVAETDIEPTQATRLIPIAYDPSYFSISLGHPIQRKKDNSVVFTTLIFGLLSGVILHFFVFYVKRKGRMDLTGSSSSMHYLENLKQAIQEYQTSVKNKLELDVSINKHYSSDSNVEVEDGFKLPLFRMLRGHSLKSNQLLETNKIDVSSTIRRTIRQMGFPEIMYQAQKPTMRIIFVMMVPQENIVERGLLNFLISKIKPHRLTDAYLLDTSCSFISKEDGSGRQSFSEFVDAHKQEYFILCGHYENIFLVKSNSTNHTSRVIETLHYVRYKSFLNTSCNPLEEYQSLLLQSEAIYSYRLQLDQLIACIRYEAIHDHQRIDWVKHELKELDQIKEYLQHPIFFQVFCALSIYPKLSWTITRLFFERLCAAEGLFQSDDHHKELHYLIRLCQLPLLQTEVISDRMRDAMLQRLEKKYEILARKCLVEFLEKEEVSVSDSTLFYNQVQIQINKNILYHLDAPKFHTYRNDLKEFQAILSETEDAATKERVYRFQLPQVAQDNWYSTMKVNRNRFVLKINLARAVVLLIPFLLFYYGFTKLRPAFIYPEKLVERYPVTIHIKANACPSLNKVTFYHKDTMPFLEWFPGLDSTLFFDDDYDTEIQVGAQFKEQEIRSSFRNKFETVQLELTKCN